MKERSPIIIIFNVQTFPAARRHLIDKAEDTSVAASGDAERRELKTEVVIRVLLNSDLSGLAVLRMKRNNDVFVSDQKTVIDNVMDFFSVNGVQDVPSLEPQPCGSSVRQDVYNLQQSGSLLGGVHEINIPCDLHKALIGNLPEFPQHHDLVSGQDFFQVIGLLFGEGIFTLTAPALCL